MARLTINISMDKKCVECRKGGAMDSGICLGCVAKMIERKPMKTEAGRAMQAKLIANLRR